MAQERRRLDLYTRAGEGWSLGAIQPPAETVLLAGIGPELTLDEIYAESGS